MLSFTNRYVLASGNDLWEKISAWYQNSLIRELLLHVKETYFSVELRAYENLHFDAGAATTIQNIILALAIGLILAAAWSVYTRSVLGGFVRALLGAGANSPENAKTLHELGFFRSTAIRRELWRGVDLRKIVKNADEAVGNAEGSDSAGKTDGTAAKEAAAEQSSRLTVPKIPTKSEPLAPPKPNYLNARYYIPEELRYRAELRYRKRGSDLGAFVVVVVVAIVLAALIGRFLPDLLQLADNLITMTSPNS